MKCSADDAFITLSLLFRMRRQNKKQESCEDSLLGSESESCVGGEGRGELVVWLVKFKGMYKSQTAGSPDSPDQQTYKPKKKRIDNYDNCADLTVCTVRLPGPV